MLGTELLTDVIEIDDRLKEYFNGLLATEVVDNFNEWEDDIEDTVFNESNTTYVVVEDIVKSERRVITRLWKPTEALKRLDEDDIWPNTELIKGEYRRSREVQWFASALKKETKLVAKTTEEFPSYHV